MYQMRGNRVSPMQEEEIAYRAINFCGDAANLLI